MTHKKKICMASGCNAPTRCRGYCARHYQQIRRHGRITPESENRSTCIISGCNMPHKARGCCANHYKELIYHGKIKTRTRLVTMCYVIDCKNTEKKHGLCEDHYRHYLCEYVQYGYSWGQVDRMVIHHNQKVLTLMKRLKLIKKRHRELKAKKEKTEKEIIFNDILRDEDIDSSMLLEVAYGIHEEYFPPEDIYEDCSLFKEGVHGM